MGIAPFVKCSPHVKEEAAMSSAQNASIFQSAWLAPFPRLTSIAAAVLTLLTAPVANASVIAAVKNAQGNDVMLFKLLSGAESGTGEDVSIKALCSKPGRGSANFLERRQPLRRSLLQQILSLRTPPAVPGLTTMEGRPWLCLGLRDCRVLSLREASIWVRHPGRHTITALLQSCPRPL